MLLRGYAFNHTADFETVRQMKEKLCYVAYDVEEEQRLALETTILVETYTVRKFEIFEQNIDLRLCDCFLKFCQVTRWSSCQIGW